MLGFLKCGSWAEQFIKNKIHLNPNIPACLSNVIISSKSKINSSNKSLFEWCDLICRQRFLTSHLTDLKVNVFNLMSGSPHSKCILLKLCENIFYFSNTPFTISYFTGRQVQGLCKKKDYKTSIFRLTYTVYLYYSRTPDKMVYPYNIHGHRSMAEILPYGIKHYSFNQSMYMYRIHV